MLDLSSDERNDLRDAARVIRKAGFMFLQDPNSVWGHARAKAVARTLDALAGDSEEKGRNDERTAGS